MREETWIQRAIRKIRELFCKRTEEEKEKKSDEAKAEMCRRAVAAGVCPKACERCAWNTFR
nr:MAG TPA: hypothetical protein [Caudoviricetes sp.]